MTDQESAPLTLLGSNISYFTGKMENYLRLKQIPYRLESMRFPAARKVLERELGVVQMPAIILPDGRFMTDTTKMIEWFEARHPEHPILPPDPVQCFLCHLLEDWADEWWWRPAMHYRWHYAEGARFASHHLATELMGSLSLPIWIKRRYMQRRQRSGYTTGDGITRANFKGVEADVAALWQQLDATLSQQPFLLGERPSLADVGFAAPFFRHFALDPVPLELLRQQAPAVLEWVARLWNTRLDNAQGEWRDGVPFGVTALLEHMGRGYLPYLSANVAAVRSGRKRFTVEIDGIRYEGARYSRYRVWCLQRLREHFAALPVDAQPEAEALLKNTGCWEPLWRDRDLPLLKGQEQALPFRGDTKMVGVNETLLRQ
jgi:glutathione S-transferase